MIRDQGNSLTKLFHLFAASVFHLYKSKSGFVKGREFIDLPIIGRKNNPMKFHQLWNTKLAFIEFLNQALSEFFRVFTPLANTLYICFHSFPLFVVTLYQGRT